MPDPLQGLLVIAARPRRRADDPRVQGAVDRDPRGQPDVLRPPVAGVAPQFRQREPEAAVPLDRAAQPARRGLDGGAPVARVQDQRLDVRAELDRPVDLGLADRLRKFSAPYTGRSAAGAWS
jgi:hypothetical protein